MVCWTWIRFITTKSKSSCSKGCLRTSGHAQPSGDPAAMAGLSRPVTMAVGDSGVVVFSHPPPPLDVNAAKAVPLPEVKFLSLPRNTRKGGANCPARRARTFRQTRVVGTNRFCRTCPKPASPATYGECDNSVSSRKWPAPIAAPACHVQVCKLQPRG